MWRVVYFSQLRVFCKDGLAFCFEICFFFRIAAGNVHRNIHFLWFEVALPFVAEHETKGVLPFPVKRVFDLNSTLNGCENTRSY